MKLESDAILEIKEVFMKELEKTENIEALNELRVRYLGRRGTVTQMLKSLGTLPEDERPKMGKAINDLKNDIEDMIKKRQQELIDLEESSLERLDAIDVTQPPKGRPWGGFHPVVEVMHELIDIFLGLGFSVALGPEVEDDFHNFEALNIPPHHPARDMQDTFYLEGSELLLRTHTSPVQVRSMLKYGAPLRIVCPGKVYRRDSDPTHSPMFHQLEGLLVDTDVSVSDLKGCMIHFIDKVFGRPLKSRFRASYFPFTEPSLEMDIECIACSGKDPSCRICKGTGWLEVCGMGMVHPNVLRAGGIDPEIYNGFAWGLGIDRVAMLKYGLNDLRMLFSGDIAFLTGGVV
ncbi:phenylalanyl-tRNA synthetase, alpha subunit [Acetomicrobium flavidum]|uniref:Phenylalanine--tRNA ligase alpha subunit n=1 Tax=Acetomicrobium flavidum TaxID=49896 RepID=A0ABY1JAT8_9BACT|nr:phenylalanyl-tRNA synthetase, alpha subunit [Acetomicrobium flavidum]